MHCKRVAILTSKYKGLSSSISPITLNYKLATLQVPASLNDRFVIRFCVCAENATDKDIQTAYDIIAQTAQHIIRTFTCWIVFMIRIIR